MKRLSEETLNAYADGALDAQARTEVEAQLATDAEARALLQKLRRANALTTEAFAAPMHEPPPQALVDAILRGAAHGAAADRSMPPGRQQSRAWSVREYALPLAAALALTIGIAAGVFLGRQAGRIPEQLVLGAVPAGSTLHRLLEHHPSGSMLDIDGARGAARRLSAVATFRDRHDRPCREVEALRPGTDPLAIAAGVACRDAEGLWLVEGAIRLGGAPLTSAGQFEPSGVPEKDALEGLLTMLGTQRALGPAEEKALIERGWKK
jgi:hypothetical protein